MNKLSQNEMLAVAAGIIVVGLIFFGSFLNPFEGAIGSAARDLVQVVDSTGQPASAAAALSGAVNARGQATKLIIEDIVEGPAEARMVADGDVVTVHYIGQLQNGVQFADSAASGEPITFRVGSRDVIEGLDEGVLGMRVGGQRVIVVPPAMGYGSQAVGPIPANSTVIFAVDLISVE